MALTPRPTTAIFVLTDQDGRQYGIDITLRQNYADRFTVTKHPVEEGAEVADHIQKTEAIVQITGEISNTPLALSEEADPRRAVTSYELLRRIADAKRTVSLATAVRSYRELAFQELVVERGSEISSETIRVSMTLIEIIRAKTQQTTLDPSLFAEDVRDSATPEQDAPGAETEPNPCARIRSDSTLSFAVFGLVTGEDTSELNNCPQFEGVRVRQPNGRVVTDPDMRIDHHPPGVRSFLEGGATVVPLP